MLESIIEASFSLTTSEPLIQTLVRGLSVSGNSNLLLFPWQAPAL
jgi:hypothetical protein